MLRPVQITSVITQRIGRQPHRIESSGNKEEGEMVISCSTTEGLRGAESNEVTFALLRKSLATMCRIDGREARVETGDHWPGKN